MKIIFSSKSPKFTSAISLNEHEIIAQEIYETVVKPQIDERKFCKTKNLKSMKIQNAQISCRNPFLLLLQAVMAQANLHSLNRIPKKLFLLIMIRFY